MTVVLAGSILFVEESCRLSSSLGNHKLGQWKRKVNELPLMYHVNKLLACYQRTIRGVKIILYCSDEGSVICSQPMGITET